MDAERTAVSLWTKAVALNPSRAMDCIAAELQAAYAAGVKDAAQVCDGPHMARSGICSFTCAELGLKIRALLEDS